MTGWTGWGMLSLAVSVWARNCKPSAISASVQPALVRAWRISSVDRFGFILLQ